MRRPLPAVLVPVLLVAALLVLLVACGSGDRDESLLGTGSPAPAASSSAPAVLADYPTSPDRLLAALAAAVLDHDRASFAALLGGDPSFRRAQLRLYANLQRLPVSDLSFRRKGDGTVIRRLDLGRYDDAPDESPAGITVGEAGSRLVVVPDARRTPREPWDLTEIRAASADGVLVVADLASAPRGRAVLRTAATALGAVDDVVPFSWRRSAVVYLFADPAVLATYSRVPGGNLQHLGALTYPLRTDAGRRTGSRVALLPTALDASSAELARIVRHELTHVALGQQGDASPTWLAEGLAEYVAAQPIPVRQRRIATIAVARAEADAVEIPDAASFNDDEQALHYAVAWMACDYLAATKGPSAPWDVAAAMARAEVGRDGDGAAVLRRTTGLGPAELADATGARIRRLFGSVVDQDPGPTPSATSVP